MKISKLRLTAFGPFTDRVLDFGSQDNSLVFVHGPNEAGKSSTLRAISDLRFGIPLHSRDNFIHDHREMLLGGVLVDRQNKEHCINRRKGRTGTLTYSAGHAVPPEVEALITCGLTKEEYEVMFGLDHERLRVGGEALLAGEGEVGAALFEASAGIHSISAVLQQLDQSARSYFMPGARAKNGRINEALRHYGECAAELKRALIKPAAWADLFKQQEAARKHVADLESRHAELNGRLREITELRAVAPLIRMLDAANGVLCELEHVTLLAESAPAERAGAEAGLAAARHNAQVESDTVQRMHAELATLVLDDTALAVASAIERLAASVDTIDLHRNDMACAYAEVTKEEKRLHDYASAIRPGLTVSQALDMAPGPTEKASVEELLCAVETAQQRLNQHQETANTVLNEAAEPAGLPVPASELRVALRSALNDVTRNESWLQRKTLLPIELKTLQRKVDSELSRLGFADHASFKRARPLLDSEIDAMIASRNKNETERGGFIRRIEQIRTATAALMLERDKLLAGGQVPTMDDVGAARAKRDAGWSLVRARFVERQEAIDEPDANGKPLIDAYEADIGLADRLVDQVASDSERAAQLQACLHEMRKLDADAAAIQKDLETIITLDEEQHTAWQQKLAAHHLPVMAPAALREWQLLFGQAVGLLESLLAKQDELDQVAAVEARLMAGLHAALAGVGASDLHPGAELSMLVSRAEKLEEEFEQREHALNTAAGKRIQREHQAQQYAAQAQQLDHALKAARANAQQVYAALDLPEDASVAAARARLREFDDLVSAKAAMDAATARQFRAKSLLEILENQARALADSLGDRHPVDARLYAEHLAVRLEKAKQTQLARSIAQKSLEQARTNQFTHEETAAKHAAVLATLCTAAKVADPLQLPEAEEHSRRKRAAFANADQARSSLARASTRPIDALRQLLEDFEAERMDAEEADVTKQLGVMQDQLRTARQAEEAARHRLQEIDGADTAAVAQENMEQAAATVRNAMAPWMRSKLAHSLLEESLKRFRERAQGPMLLAASRYFHEMTDGRFDRLVSDDSSGSKPILLARRDNGTHITVDGMSEGTRDQLFLSLRLAALEIRRAAGFDLPVVLDDVLVTSDDARAALALKAISEFSKGHQVIVFTHHHHLINVAEKCVPNDMLAVVGI